MVDDNKKGPVRPPILDAEAKKPSSSAENSTTSTSKSDAKPSTATSSATKPADKKPIDPPKSTRESSNDEGSGMGTFVAAIVLSAALGIAGTAGLAYYKVFPFNQWAAQSDLAPEIAKLQKRIFDLENAQPDLSPFATNDDLSTLQAEIDAIDTAQIEQAIANIEAQLATIESPSDTSTAIDLGPIETALEGLEQDVANLKETQAQLAERSATAAEPNSEQPSAPPVDLTPVNDQLATQSENLSALDEQLATQKQALADLQSQIAELEAQIKTLEQDQSARQTAASALAAARLPILMSEIDTNIEKGDPFARPITELSSILGTAPSPEVMGVAENGLVPASALAGQFGTLRPQLMAARPGVPNDAPWQDKLLGAVKDAVNLRPIDAQDDDPLSLVEQIGTALEAEDVQNAQMLIQKLPAQMQEILAPISTNISQHILIDQWMVETRSTLLNQNAQESQNEGDAQ
ncbi:hypothetical protein ATL17_2783 [Maritalea mobilis]|uniref:Inner membrane protein n=1 Tax=Maritalea mobilis TaxID=483324 RepID=A0A4R6VFB4_9HYPH|nr:hypothetical protein [Maritalea mobilis]TDQ61684.1 hypothetical protein ATL17_2783 [Maritalea mobilis]